MKKIPIIIDCDPGVDDAIAIIVANALPQLDIKAITSVAGNVQLKYTTHNMQALASLLDLKCPIAEGEDRPLIKKQVIAGKTHGADGFGGHSQLLSHLPLRSLDSLHAVKLIAKILQESDEKITIAAIGPLTNIALLVKNYPELLPKIEKFSIMGGGLKYGNITPTAEFNFYVDPEAAHIVFNSGVPIVLASLDVTLSALVNQEDINFLSGVKNSVSELAVKILSAYAENDAALHDPVSIFVLTHPHLFKTEELYIQIETNEGSTRAMSYADNRHKCEEKPNTTFITEIDRKQFIQEIYNAFETYGE